MNLIARLFALRAFFTSVERAHHARHLKFSSFVLLMSLSSMASAVEVSRCGDGQAVAGHYILRALSRAESANSVSAKSSSPLIEELIQASSTRVLHRATSTPQSVSSQQLTEKSTAVVSTIATQLSDAQVNELQSDKSVLSIEEDCLVQIETATLPDDPIPQEYTHAREQLNLPEAWSIKTDSSAVIVAVSDTGVDLAHEDLSANLWTNSAELNGRAGVDDDANGCIDDIHGCDFGDYDGDPSPPNTGQGGHGTHVAGIIGAAGNNTKGTSGVAWKARLLVAKGFDRGGYAAISDLVNSVYYSINNGARVINCSWGADRSPTQAERDAFQYALDSGVLAVVAAGNSSIDASRSSPASLESVLTVGSINSQDKVSAFSNYGSKVHVYAPGGDAGAMNEYIYSTFPANQYGPLRGTSMAAPFVSGIASLVFSVNPRLSAVDVRSIIVSTSREVSSVLPDGSTALIRIPDAAAALTRAATYTPTPFGVSQPPPTPNYQSPKGEQSGPEFIETSTSSSSCALHQTSRTDFSGLVFLILPLFSAWALRKRTPTLGS